MRARIYTDKERAHALAVLDVCEGDASEASRKLKIPRRTLAEWQSGRIARVQTASVRQEEKENLADAFERVARLCVTRLTESDIIEKCNRPSELSTVAGTAVDKMRLLRGQAPPGADADSLRIVVEEAVGALVGLCTSAGIALSQEEARSRIQELRLKPLQLTAGENR